MSSTEKENKTIQSSSSELQIRLDVTFFSALLRLLNAAPLAKQCKNNHAFHAMSTPAFEKKQD